MEMSGLCEHEDCFEKVSMSADEMAIFQKFLCKKHKPLEIEKSERVLPLIGTIGAAAHTGHFSTWVHESIYVPNRDLFRSRGFRASAWDNSDDSVMLSGGEAEFCMTFHPKYGKGVCEVKTPEGFHFIIPESCREEEPFHIFTRGSAVEEAPRADEGNPREAQVKKKEVAKTEVAQNPCCETPLDGVKSEAKPEGGKVKDADGNVRSGKFGCPQCGCQKVKQDATFKVRGTVPGSRVQEFDDDGDEVDYEDDYDTSDFDEDEQEDCTIDGDVTCDGCGEDFDEDDWKLGEILEEAEEEVEEEEVEEDEEEDEDAA